MNYTHCFLLQLYRCLFIFRFSVGRLLNSTECVNLSRMSSTINQQQTICLHSSTAKYVHPICPGVKIRDRNADWSEIRDRNAQGRQTRERSTELIKSREINAEWSETIDRNVEWSIPNRGVDVTTQHEHRNEESALVVPGSTEFLAHSQAQSVVLLKHLFLQQYLELR